MYPYDCTYNAVKRERDCAQIPAEQNASLQRLIRPHIDSFNYFSNEGLITAVAYLEGKEVTDSVGNRLEYWLEEVQLGRPMVSERDHKSIQRFVYPVECRERGCTYKAKLQARLCWSVNGGPVSTELKAFGHIPIMVKSDRCTLKDLVPKDLVRHHEDPEELGGYFVVNGIEKLIRLLVVPRRNLVMGLIRPSFSRRGPQYTEYGTMIRCARDDQSTQTVTVHYLSTGDCTLRVSYKKQEFLIPVVLILKSLLETNDQEIYENILQGRMHTFLRDRVEFMLYEFKRFHLYSRKQCLAYMGSRFRVLMDMADRISDEEVGEVFLRRFILVHLQDHQDKFTLLIFMIQKLYSLVHGECVPDNPDSPMNQEILLSGHLFLIYFKEKLQDWLNALKTAMTNEIRRTESHSRAFKQVNLSLEKKADFRVEHGQWIDFHDPTYFRKCISKVSSDLGRKMEYLLSTGNLITSSGLDLQQVSGYTLVAEKLNFLRYLSHFRSVHRGSFFSEIKSTTVRKLLPEAWGFLCPVHTPDGAPCGLLNHLSHTCEVVAYPDHSCSNLPRLLIGLGMTPLLRHAVGMTPLHLPVLFNGRILGRCSSTQLKELAEQLRMFKVKGLEGISPHLEIVHIPPSTSPVDANGSPSDHFLNKKPGQLPGLYLFTTPARMLRPVRHLQTGQIEMIGSFEQVYLDIACEPKDIIRGITTHLESTPINILSVVANMTPFSDFNQSPRNMHQCQMGKQSMGTPTHAWHYRCDNKLYRLLTPQTPAVRPRLYNEYNMDNYPNGTNAIVAVISYTGYDMEDAMILNKSSFERGFAHGTIYKTEYVDLSEMRIKGEPILHHFGVTDKRMIKGKLDMDGLPHVGIQLESGDPMYSILDETTGLSKIGRYKGTETAFVESVKLLGSDNGDLEMQKIAIKLRIPRNPIIGDKFSSRHGQKGVCSFRWPAMDMPFSESGIIPDIIINPHAFPSRMTIGMLVESMAGKSAALHGIFQDATPFQFSEDYPAVDYFGEQLRQTGFQYHGNEPMYSGITGQEFRTDIFMGVVYYQRLRHMVSDKYQVRTTGPVHSLTQQPVKGRKRAGGIRFGEMERDSLLAHGVSFLLRDRLMNCSDESRAYVCHGCGSILSLLVLPPNQLSTRRDILCTNCQHGKKVVVVSLPHVFRYLATELLAMNIRMDLQVTESF